jgi:quercetin dioxygenase-like cupin family protein
MFLDDYKRIVRFSDEHMVKINLHESHRMFADLYCLGPGQKQPVHSHDDEDKLYVVLEGRVHCTIGQEERELAPGGAAVAPAGERHGIRCEGPDPAVVITFMAPHPSLSREEE